MFFSFPYNPYIAIIGDIKKSQKLKDRKVVQDKLKILLDHINGKYHQDVSAKFMITLGDEFQGLLRNGSNIIKMIEQIQREMYPVEIRFGLGIGAITTDINSEMAIGADGPGYYKARQAIDFLKQNELKNMTSVSDIRIEADGDNESTIVMLNTILSLLAVLKTNWTNRQREIIWDSLKYEDGQGKSAERLSIAQSSVQRGLNNGNYYAYKGALDTVSNILKQIRGEDV